MKAYIKNLRNGERERTALCRVCLSENSADKSDYFMAKETDSLKCHNRIMDIVVKKTVYVEVKE
jgi:hypothetical protein